MAHNVVFRPAAERDLLRLYRYIRDERSEPLVAMGYINRIRAYRERFGDLPERGTRRDDIRKGLRIAGFERRVAIAFTVEGDTVRIGRIFYGGRHHEELLGAGK